MPCLSAIRGDTELADMYHRLVRARKKPKAAHGAVMRKMLLVMRAILISGEPSAPDLLFGKASRSF